MLNPVKHLPCHFSKSDMESPSHIPDCSAAPKPLARSTASATTSASSTVNGSPATVSGVARAVHRKARPITNARSPKDTEIAFSEITTKSLSWQRPETELLIVPTKSSPGCQYFVLMGFAIKRKFDPARSRGLKEPSF